MASDSRSPKRGRVKQALLPTLREAKLASCINSLDRSLIRERNAISEIICSAFITGHLGIATPPNGFNGVLQSDTPAHGQIPGIGSPQNLHFLCLTLISTTMYPARRMIVFLQFGQKVFSPSWPGMLLI